MDIVGILRRALAGGGEFAEIYFEEGASTQVVVEGGKVEKVFAFADRGVGIRVISDFRTALGYTNDVTGKSLLALAETISSAVNGKRFDKPIAIISRQIAPPSQILLHP